MFPWCADTPLPVIQIDGDEPYAEYEVGADDEWQDEETAIFSYDRPQFADESEIDMAIRSIVDPNVCAVDSCGEYMPPSDRIAVDKDRTKFAHFRCIAQMAVGARQGGKVVVIAERRGQWRR